MFELNVIKFNEQPVVDSREVAKIVGKEHKTLMRDIRTYINYLNESKIVPVDFFIESNYTDIKGEIRPCYLITKKGCEMVANKMTGAKGVTFTALYVNVFNEMENKLATTISEKDLLALKVLNATDSVERLTALSDYTECVKKPLLDTIHQQADTIDKQAPKVELANKRLALNGCCSITDANKTFNLKQGQLIKFARTMGMIHQTRNEVNKKGERYFKIYSKDGEHSQIGITEDGLTWIKDNLFNIQLIKLTRKSSKPQPKSLF